MSQPAQNPWTRRVRRLTYVIGVAGTFYLISTYAIDRMREARLRALKERKERDLLKAHFTTLLSTISITLYALLPTLSPQLDEVYPIEATSQALQGLSNPSSSQISSVSGDGANGGNEQDDNHDVLGQSGQSIPDIPTLHAEADLTAPGGVHTENQAQSSSSSFGAESHRDRTESVTSSSAASAVHPEGSVSESWASEFRDRHGASGGADDEALSLGVPETDDGLSSATSQPISLPPTDLSTSSGSPPSEMTASSQLLLSPSPPRHRLPSPARAPSRSRGASLEGKSKKELWRDLKVQSIAKAITIAYLIPLLHLLTTSQLTVLARERYLADVKTSLAPSQPDSVTPPTSPDDDSATQPSLLGEAMSLLPNPLSILPGFVTSRLPFSRAVEPVSSLHEKEEALRRRQEKEEQEEADRAEAERLYLTYSWWILHEGWREVARRVDRAVEEVIGPLALKRELGLQDWEGLILDIRRHVEYEHETEDAAASRPFAFGSIVLPPSPLPPATSPDCPLPLSPPTPHLQALLAQTRAHISSPDSTHLIKLGTEVMLRKLVESLSEDLYPTPRGGTSSGGKEAGRRRRLAECLPAFNSWAQGVLAAVPDSGVEAVLGIPDCEAFAGLVFGDWADANVAV